MTANMENCRMAKVMAKEGRVTSLLSISTKGEDIVESKRRWKEVFLQSTGGKECLLVVARGGADFFQYLIHQVRIVSNMQYPPGQNFAKISSSKSIKKKN